MVTAFAFRVTAFVIIKYIIFVANIINTSTVIGGTTTATATTTIVFTTTTTTTATTTTTTFTATIITPTTTTATSIYTTASVIIKTKLQGTIGKNYHCIPDPFYVCQYAKFTLIGIFRHNIYN